jgi:hypothetical protein
MGVYGRSRLRRARTTAAQMPPSPDPKAHGTDEMRVETMAPERHVGRTATFRERQREETYSPSIRPSTKSRTEINRRMSQLPARLSALDGGGRGPLPSAPPKPGLVLRIRVAGAIAARNRLPLAVATGGARREAVAGANVDLVAALGASVGAG